MSELRLRAEGPHQCYEPHPLGWVSPELVENWMVKTRGPSLNGESYYVCPGGREVVLREQVYESRLPYEETPVLKECWEIVEGGDG